MNTYSITDFQLNTILDMIQQLRAEDATKNGKEASASEIASVVKYVLDRQMTGNLVEEVKAAKTELESTKNALVQLRLTCLMAANTAKVETDREERVPSLLLEKIELLRADMNTALRAGAARTEENERLKSDMRSLREEADRQFKIDADRSWNDTKRITALWNNARLAAQVAGIPLDGPEDQFATKAVQKLLDECKKLETTKSQVVDQLLRERKELEVAKSGPSEALTADKERADAFRDDARLAAQFSNVSIANLPETQFATAAVQKLIDDNVALMSKFGSELSVLRKAKDAAYHERNQVVALLAAMAGAQGLTMGMGEHVDQPGEEPWDPKWRNVVYIDLPQGQVSWHIHEDELPIFFEYPKYDRVWDGHDTKKKYMRVAEARVNYMRAARERASRREQRDPTVNPLVSFHETMTASEAAFVERSRVADKGAVHRDLTLRELQTQLPWTIHYHRDFRASPMVHKDFGHALLHVHKAAGKLSALVDDAEHKGCDFKPGDVDPYVADLVVCALWMANVCPNRVIDLQVSVERRIEMKNNVTLSRPPTR